MKQFLKNNATFLCGALLVLMAMLIALFVVPKADLHLWLNGVHTPWLDSFFRHYSNFVKWPVYILMLLPLLVWKPGWTAVFACTEAASALCIQALKYAFNMPRPKTFFEEWLAHHPSFAADWQQIMVDGVNMHSWHSFPSGHTASFFVFFSLCAFIWAYEQWPRKNEAAIVCLILALLGGYSRIYLSQHFLMDVCAGMAEGVLMSVVMFWLFTAKGWTEKQWFNKRLRGVKKD